MKLKPINKSSNSLQLGPHVCGKKRMFREVLETVKAFKMLTVVDFFIITNEIIKSRETDFGERILLGLYF